MAAPATVRVNVGVPFPPLVKGSGPVTIGKVNGVFTVGFSIISLNNQVPPVGNYPNDYVIVWDDIAKSFFRVSLSALAGTSRTQRSVTASPIVIQATDMILNVNISAGSPTCALPTAASRGGIPLTFKDVGSQFAAHNLTITPNGAETIDGAANVVLGNNRQGITLNPYTDGVNTGWEIL